MDLSTGYDIQILTFRKLKEDDYDWSNEPVKFNIPKMLAHHLVRKRLLTDESGNEWGVRRIGVGIIGNFGESYDHARTRSLKKWKRYPQSGAMLPVWEWILIREDNRRFRFRCDLRSPQKTFMCNEWPVGHTHEWIQPPSTGAGKDSKRAVDGWNYYFRRVKQQHHYKNPTSGIDGMD